VLAIVAVVMAVSMFYPQYQQYVELQRRQAALEEEYRLQEEKLKLLRSNQERMTTDPRFVEKIAREELGFAKEGETVVKFVDDQRGDLSRP
jgi:cell division protein FtsB